MRDIWRSATCCKFLNRLQSLSGWNAIKCPDTPNLISITITPFVSCFVLQRLRAVWMNLKETSTQEDSSETAVTFSPIPRAEKSSNIWNSITRLLHFWVHDELEPTARTAKNRSQWEWTGLFSAQLIDRWSLMQRTRDTYFINRYVCLDDAQSAQNTIKVDTSNGIQPASDIATRPTNQSVLFLLIPLDTDANILDPSVTSRITWHAWQQREPLKTNAVVRLFWLCFARVVDHLSSFDGLSLCGAVFWWCKSTL